MRLPVSLGWPVGQRGWRGVRRWAPPRVRGEQCRTGPAYQASLGPSPRARGAVVSLCAACPVRGSIPACAGRSRRGRRPRGRCRVHPRVRGEKELRSYTVGTARGPSPRARGEARHARRAPPLRGSIPACAGSSRAPGRRPRAARVHPRVRGEQQLPGDEHIRRLGPSPRARGADSEPICMSDRLGSIPACAGSSDSDTGQCGASSGPSPRARGAVDYPVNGLSRVGSIPACAGSRAALTAPRW